LSLCYSKALDEAVKHNVRSIAFPCLSVGAGFPLEDATNVALGTVRSWMEKHHSDVDLIVFGLHRPEEVQAYQKWMQWYFPASHGTFLSCTLDE